MKIPWTGFDFLSWDINLVTSHGHKSKKNSGKKKYRMIKIYKLIDNYEVKGETSICQQSNFELVVEEEKESICDVALMEYDDDIASKHEMLQDRPIKCMQVYYSIEDLKGTERKGTISPKSLNKDINTISLCTHELATYAHEKVSAMDSSINGVQDAKVGHNIYDNASYERTKSVNFRTNTLN